MKKIYVYYAQTSVDTAERELYPRERTEEINGCKNESVKREKYYAWRLLEYAIKDVFSLDFNNLQFTKLPSGQWICDGCRFSISHSSGRVAVAVSDSDVGVDIEAVHDIDERIANKALTDAEFSHYKRLKDGSREEYLLETASDDQLAAIISAFPSVEKAHDCQLTFSTEAVAVSDVMGFMAKANISPLKLERMEPTLESLFMEVTKK